MVGRSWRLPRLFVCGPKCFFPALPDAPDSKHVGNPFPNPEAADLWRARFTLRMPRLSPAAPSLLEGFDWSCFSLVLAGGRKEALTRERGQRAKSIASELPASQL